MKAIVKETNEEVEVRLLRPIIYSRLGCNGKVIKEYNEDELLIDPKETSVSDDLETEIEWFAKTNESNDYVKIARHFAEWEKQRMIDKFNEWCQDEFMVHPHDPNVVQYVSEKPFEDIDDFVEEFIRKME